jgi:arylsulfatase
MKPKLILILITLFASILVLPAIVFAQAQQTSPTPATAKKPNILVIFGDDIGQTNVSAYSMGVTATRRRTSIALRKKG